MKRRPFLIASCFALLPLSGCTANPGENGGLLEILETQPPSGATVTPSSDERIRTIKPIQTALDRVSKNGTANLRIDKSESDATATALSSLPWYERKDDFPSGIYLHHKGSTSVASLWPYCVDSVLGSAESERGVYGRGGCLDPEERPGNP